jgi:hypothetical protein
VCYCFDISMADIEAARKENDGDACRQFVIQQTKASTCDCETRNPSGKCCLGDFPKSQSV